MLSIREDILIQNFLNSLNSSITLMCLLIFGIRQPYDNLQKLITLEISLSR